MDASKAAEPNMVPLVEEILKTRPEVFKEIYARLEQAKQEGGFSPPTWYYEGDLKWGSPEMKAFNTYHSTRRAAFILKNDLSPSKTIEFFKCSLLAICEGMTVDSDGNLFLTATIRPKKRLREA